MIIENWKQMWKSYAVIFPALLTAIFYLIEAGVSQNLFPENWMPIAVFLSSFLGRIISQNNLKGGV